MNTENLGDMDLDAVGPSLSNENGIDNNVIDTPVVWVAPTDGESVEQTDAPAEVVTETTEVAPEEPADVIPAVEGVVRKTAGRKFDNAGKTNLGKCRILYAANPDMKPKELKALFMANTDITGPVAQTYASIVRKKPKAKAA